MDVVVLLRGTWSMCMWSRKAEMANTAPELVDAKYTKATLELIQLLVAVSGKARSEASWQLMGAVEPASVGSEPFLSVLTALMTLHISGNRSQDTARPETRVRAARQTARFLVQQEASTAE